MAPFVPKRNAPDGGDEVILFCLASAPPGPKLNVEAPVAGVFGATTGVLSAPPNPEKVEEAGVTASATAAGPKLKVQQYSCLMAGAPKVNVEVGATANDV